MTCPVQPESVHLDFPISASPSPKADMSSQSPVRTRQRSSGDSAISNESDCHRRKRSSGDSGTSNDSDHHRRKRSSDNRSSDDYDSDHHRRKRSSDKRSSGDSATSNDSDRYQDMRIPKKSAWSRHCSQNIRRDPVPSFRQLQHQSPVQPALHRQQATLFQLEQQVQQEAYQLNKAAIFAKQQQLEMLRINKMYNWRTGEMYNRNRIQVQKETMSISEGLNPLKKRPNKRYRGWMARQIQNQRRQSHKRRKI